MRIKTRKKKNTKEISADGLTLRQKRFIEEFLIDNNATQAYMRAYNNPNRNTAQNEGYKLLKNPKIIAIVMKEMENRSDPFYPSFFGPRRPRRLPLGCLLCSKITC